MDSIVFGYLCVASRVVMTLEDGEDLLRCFENRPNIVRIFYIVITIIRKIDIIENLAIAQR